MKIHCISSWLFQLSRIFIVMSTVNVALASSNIEQGDAAFANRDITKAIQQYQIELKNNPKSVIARTKLAKCYIRKGYKSAVTKMIAEATILNPSDIETLLLKSKLHIWNKQQDEAVKLLKQVIALRPDNLEALNQLSGIYNDDGNTEAADALYIKMNALRVGD